MMALYPNQIRDYIQLQNILVPQNPKTPKPQNPRFHSSEFIKRVNSIGDLN